jgi:hypothetical protein
MIFMHRRETTVVFFVVLLYTRVARRKKSIIKIHVCTFFIIVVYTFTIFRINLKCELSTKYNTKKKMGTRQR